MKKPGVHPQRLYRYAALRRVLTRRWTRPATHPFEFDSRGRTGIATSHPGESGDVGELRK